MSPLVFSGYGQAPDLVLSDDIPKISYSQERHRWGQKIFPNDEINAVSNLPSLALSVFQR